ncbi:MAG: hypothetical protein JWM36_2391 [Hyphomicrobiales bacterium]|nr:hypothetical protein [Hyphomicrobiales bacterium]
MRRLPILDDLLVSGGDERIALDPRGLNRYGYGPLPVRGECAFGSSTASTISVEAHLAAALVHGRLATALLTQSPERVYEREMERLRQSLLALWGFAESASPDLIFAASGTDAHLYAAHFLAASGDTGSLTITVERLETGSGVPEAMKGHHFAARTASGNAVDRGQVLSHSLRTQHLCIPARDAMGGLRPEPEVAADLERHITHATSAGRSILLVVADVSKTGLISPGLETVMNLRQRWAGRLDVMIDACQFRLSPRMLRAYIEHGFLVALTGSKFTGGPAFSGLLLCPPALAKAAQGRELPVQLGDYGACAEWPQGWVARRAMRSGVNFGLLLRWHAALRELQAFYSLPEATIRHVAGAFAEAINTRLHASRTLPPTATRDLDRRALGHSGGWDDYPTIFPFLLRTEHGCYLPSDASEQVYRELARGGGGARSMRLGQPVCMGSSDGRPVSALRLCFSARLAVEAARSPLSLQAVVNRALGVLDEAAALAAGIGEGARLSCAS